MNVPFFPYPKVFTEHESEYLEIFKRVGRSGSYIMQSDLKELESELANYVGAPFAVGVGNATDGLELLLQCANIKAGDEVLFSSHTMVATASAIASHGAIPVPVESDLYGRMDLKSAMQHITPKTVAIMPTQLNGTTCDMDGIIELAESRNLLLIEDSAQGLGAKYKGRFAGTFGFGGCISFYPAKNLPCLGDGGIVFVKDEETYQNMMLLRDHGRDPHTGEVMAWGRNSRLDNLQAAFIMSKFRSYPETIEKRRMVASRYQERLAGIAEILLPPAPDSDKNRYDVFQNYEIQAEKRDELRLFLREKGIGTIIQWGGKAVHQFENLNLASNLPFTDNLMKKLLLLPMNPYLSEAEISYVCQAIEDFYN